MSSKILIADDDRDLVSVLRKRLEQNGYITCSAYEGVRAVEMAHKEKPDLIILDWKMPSGKGGDVLEFLSERDDTRNIPVIILTGLDDPEIEEKAKKFGVKAVFHKPYDHNTFLKKIHEVLEWKRAR